MGTTGTGGSLHVRRPVLDKTARSYCKAGRGQNDWAFFLLNKKREGQAEIQYAFLQANDGERELMESKA